MCPGSPVIRTSLFLALSAVLISSAAQAQMPLQVTMYVHNSPAATGDVLFNPPRIFVDITNPNNFDVTGVSFTNTLPGLFIVDRRGFTSGIDGPCMGAPQ